MEEEDEIQAQACKLPRVLENGIRNGEEDRGSTNRLHRWHHSSRIIRVSRASGGKDRHSKVMTSKGLRDRRVRLSVTTAIQFYDLQDRLGYDQPSKAVEWLIKSAADSIAELPSLNNTFPDTPKSDGENNNNNNNNNKCLSKSGCSSTSETSKGSGLSLSRSDIRVKARERARERTAKEKEKENTNELHQQQQQHHHHNVNPISQTASFTELLTGGISNAVPTTITTPRGCDEVNMFNKAPMDYFLGPSSSRTTYHHHQSCSSGFSLSQIQLPETMNSVSAFNNSSSDPHQLQQHFSFIPDHLMSAVVTSSSAAAVAAAQASGNEYNLNFSISSGLAGYNRGTLQSNSHPSMLPHLQRFSPVDGSTTVPFFVGAAPATATAVENNNNNHHHHQFSSVFDGSRFQLYYADGCRHSDHNKGKPKN